MKPPAQKQWPKGGGYYDRWQSCPWCPMKSVETRRASKIYNLQRCCMMLWHIIRNLTSFGKESFEACSFDRWFYIPHLGIQLVSSEASSPNADRCECGLKGWRVKRPEIRHQNHVKHYICSLGVSSYVQLCYCKLLNGVDHFFHNSDNSSILQLYCKKIPLWTGTCPYSVQHCGSGPKMIWEQQAPGATCPYPSLCRSFKR